MIDLTDMFCGAGGSSTGAIQVPGVQVITAMNHWDLALETHNANHPDTDHVQADISQYDPRRVRRTRMLWGSPECTNHSVAKGRRRITNQPDLFGDTLPDEAADRSRATMWDMVRYAECHDYDLVFVENVVDARRWLFFDAWLACFHKMGYLHHIVYLNSMHAQHGGLPAPQSRDRMYVVFWKKGNRRPDFDKYFRPKAYCPGCDEVVDAMQVFKKSERWGRYRAQYVYRCPKTSCRNQIIEPGWLPAASAIDWSLKGERIGDRSKPLAAKTVARILAGLEKYGREPYLSLMRSGRARNYPLTDTLQTLTTEGAGHCLVDPRGITSLLMEYYGNGGMRELTEAIPTISTHDRFAMITTLRGMNAPKLVSQPLDTFAANGTHHAMITRHYSHPAGADLGHLSKSPGDPLGSITTSDHHSVTEWTVPDIEDCLFRMLEPHEIKRGMAFPSDYVMLGNKRVQVKLAGNAVTPPAARDLVACGVESLS